jgi:hypothetical protein
VDRSDDTACDEAHRQQSRHHEAAHAPRPTPHIFDSLDSQRWIHARSSGNPWTRPSIEDGNLFEHVPRTTSCRSFSRSGEISGRFLWMSRTRASTSVLAATCVRSLSAKTVHIKPSHLNVACAANGRRKKRAHCVDPAIASTKADLEIVRLNESWSEICSFRTAKNQETASGGFFYPCLFDSPSPSFSADPLRSRSFQH